MNQQEITNRIATIQDDIDKQCFYWLDNDIAIPETVGVFLYQLQMMLNELVDEIKENQS